MTFQEIANITYTMTRTAIASSDKSADEQHAFASDLAIKTHLMTTRELGETVQADVTVFLSGTTKVSVTRAKRAARALAESIMDKIDLEEAREQGLDFAVAVLGG